MPMVLGLATLWVTLNYYNHFIEQIRIRILQTLNDGISCNRTQLTFYMDSNIFLALILVEIRNLI